MQSIPGLHNKESVEVRIAVFSCSEENFCAGKQTGSSCSKLTMLLVNASLNFDH